ncbi:hypothetical protein BGZ96_001063 [Linnemannia gamsii]|uniref:Peptide hydrolase n=1 Tax=Linnemannia gamsii TaxID=64522 RepID=A0ABQ7JN97_9FUNG|nr:hypothetical protein BGZ96_001063 [Linnemannia gamsii]
MNSPPPVTSRANRRRALSLDNPSTPLLGSIGRRRSDRRVQDEVAQRIHRLHVVSPCQCWSMYSVLLLLYALVLALVYFARRPDGFVPTVMPDLAIGDTKPGTFNPHTAMKHLEAITTIPHPFNSRANTDITKQYLRDQFRELQEEAVALGRRNVRYDDGAGDNSTWVRRYKTRQQRRMEDEGLVELVDENEVLLPENMEVVQGDNMVMWIGGVVESMEGQVPVRVEIDVDQESQSALLVSAHFDSVSTSYGATDNGGGVAVALALIRHFIHHPVEHTLIFNVNNAEEDGLLGAAVFMGAPSNSTTETGQGHPWKKHVKAFINLEGAGSGGPSLLFRASNSDIVRQYAGNAPFPHASVFSNDIFQLGLINSDTDYTIYTQHDIPGLDIAFYQRRSMYHSATDYLPIQSLHHMGSNVQATIVGLCNSPYLDELSAGAEASKRLSPFSPLYWFSGKGIFYDILGKYMILSELWTALLANILLLGLGLPMFTLVTIIVGRAIRRRQMSQHVPTRTSEQNIAVPRRNGVDSPTPSLLGDSDDGYTTFSPRLPRQHAHQRAAIARQYYDVPRRIAVLRTLALVVLVVALDLGAIFAASKWQWNVNPLVRHSQQWVVLVGFGVFLAFVNTLAVSSFTLVESSLFGPLPIVRGFSQWTIALGLWWWLIVLVIGTGVAGWAGAGAFYGTTVLSVCSAGAALIQIVLNFSVPADGTEGAGVGWIIVLATSLLVPGVILSDLLVLVAHMTSQSLISVDGGIMYILYGLLTIPIMLPMLPIISRGRNFKITLLFELVVLVSFAWFLSQADPFTDTYPTSLHFSQYYNQTAKTSYVNLRASAGPGFLQRLIQDIPYFQPGTNGGPLNSTCTPIPIEGALDEKCQFVPTRQVFEDKGREAPLRVDWISKPTLGTDGWREGRIQVLALESRFCSVRMPKVAPGHETQVWMENTDVPQLGVNHRPKTLYVYMREWNSPWIVHVRVKERSLRGLQGLDAAPDGESPFSVPFRVVCGYEDWFSRKGYASTYNEISAHIPSWSRMKSEAKQGLFSVGVDMVL